VIITTDYYDSHYQRTPDNATSKVSNNLTFITIS